MRSEDPREELLTKRLLSSVKTAAGDSWNFDVSWGETDHRSGAMKRLANADALVIMGGPDVTPTFYGGETKYKNATTHFPWTDEAQLALIHTAIDRHIPTLGICRGMQLLNVAQGGTLIQDMSQLGGHASHNLMTDYVFDRHSVSIAGDSRLAGVLAPNTNSAGGLRTVVHSAHHQAVDRLGDSLVVTATADDGTVEAVEHMSAPVMGLQWHPEAPDADPRALSAILARMLQRCCATPIAA